MKKAEMVQQLTLLKKDAEEVERMVLVPAVIRRMLARSIVLIDGILERVPNDAPQTKA